MGETFAGIAQSGPLLLGVAVAAIAGLVSFLSPCMLPLVPGYLSYVTGLAGADLDATKTPATEAGAGGAEAGAGATEAVTTRTRRAAQGRVLAGTLLFIAGFGAVFIATGVVVASVGRALLEYERVVQTVVGALIVVFGLALLGLVPGLRRELRIRALPAAGLAGAPVLGAVFALSWVPCVGPTLGAVLGLAAVGGQTGRAVTLAAAYTLGIGLPFVLFGLGFRRLIGVVAVIRRHSVWITRAGGILLVLVGLALMTGAWADFLIWLKVNVGVGTVSV